MNMSKIESKIKALLSKTVENGCTEQEAIAALAMARKLMAKYKVEISETENSITVEHITIDYDYSIEWIAELIQVFINQFDVLHYVLVDNDRRTCVLYGSDYMTKCLKMLIESAIEYSIKESDKYAKEVVTLFGSCDDDEIYMFHHGFANGVYAKYIEQNSEREFKSLMVIDADVQKQYDDDMQKMNAQKEEHTQSTDVNDVINYLEALSSGYNSGYGFGRMELCGTYE